MAPAAGAGRDAETFPSRAEQEAASTHKALYGSLPPGYDPNGPAPRSPGGLAGLGGHMGQLEGPATVPLSPRQDPFIRKLYSISPAAGREAERHAYSTRDLQTQQHLERVEYLGRIAEGVLEADTQEAYDVG